MAEQLNIPDFLRGTASWARNGYFYYDNQPKLFLDSRKNGWRIFYSVLERAKAGDLSQMEALHEWIYPTFYHVLSNACLGLLGDAGNESDLNRIRSILDHAPEEFLGGAARAAANTGYLSFVPPMLSAWKRSISGDAHSQIGLAIADIMVPFGSQIAELSSTHDVSPELLQKLVDRKQLSPAEPWVPTQTEFEQLVLRRYDELKSLYPGNVSLWQGDPFDVQKLIREMMSRAQQGVQEMQGVFIAQRHKLEATIGWNLSSAFKDRVPNPLGAMALLEDILENVDLDRFVIGRRYFFGHLVNDGITSSIT